MVSQADIYLKKDCLFASPLEIEYAIDNQSLLKNFLHTMRDRLIAGVPDEGNGHGLVRN